MTEFKDWIEDRPQVIQDLAAHYPPENMYRLTTTGHTVFLYSYSEDGTVTVVVTPELNPDVSEGRRVFGIDPSDLEVITTH